MIAIYPRDFPTEAEALNYAWLTGLKSDNECNADGEGGAILNQGASTLIEGSAKTDRLQKKNQTRGQNK